MKKKPVVIIAEDNKFSASIYKTKLIGEQFEVLVVENGEEAMKALRAKPPDLLLLDLIMPVKDGFDVLKDIKGDKALQGVKTVVFTNLTQDEDRDRAIALGAHGFIVKTKFSLNEVVEKIKQFLP